MQEINKYWRKTTTKCKSMKFLFYTVLLIKKENIHNEGKTLKNKIFM